MSEQQKTYEQMSNDQLLNLALEVGSLTPDAQAALHQELSARNLGADDVSQLAAYQYGVRTQRQKPLAQSFNGFGTKIYGKRDFGDDGSFVTTKWIVLLWVPLIPLRSLRVTFEGIGESNYLPGWSRRYYILSESKPHTLQVISVYSYIATLLVGSWALDRLTLVSWSGITWLAGFFAWISIPWLLRKRARRRST
jgi:hypothetical protein